MIEYFKDFYKDNNLILEEIEEYLNGKRKEFSFTPTQSGSDFQIKVWNEISKIPYGKTITYKELAKRVGTEKAVRAVATACGKNKYPIIIPCHRVLGSNGNLGGYSAGGIEIKKLLLKIEETIS